MLVAIVTQLAAREERRGRAAEPLTELILSALFLNSGIEQFNIYIILESTHCAHCQHFRLPNRFLL